MEPTGRPRFTVARRWAWGTAAVVLLGAAVVLLVRSRGLEILEPPAPAIVDEDVRLEPIPPSVLAVPLAIPLERLTSLLEEAVPRTFGSMDERRPVPDEDRAALAFTLERDTLRASMAGSVARVETTVAYALRAWYDPPILPELSGSCGTGDEGPRRLRVVIEAPLRMSERWTLATRSELVALDPVSELERDRCRVTFLNIDLTDRVIEGARSYLEEQEATVDSIAGAIDLRSSFEAWWRTLGSPIELTERIWLTIGPGAIHQGRVHGAGDTVWVDLALEAWPRIHVGSRPRNGAAPLPPLDDGEVESGLDIVLEAAAEYGTVSDMLTERLVGTELEHEGRRVRIDSLRVYGIGAGRVALEARVSGDDVSARLYLTGTPRLDRSTGLVSVPDLDFDVATEDLLLAAASWLRRQGLETTLRERASWPSAPAADSLATWLELGLNHEISDDLRLVGEVHEVVPLGVWALREHLVVRLGARASAEVHVKP